MFSSVPVFGHGPAGDADALFLEQPADDFLVGKRAAGVFPLEDLRDHVLHARVGEAVAVGGHDPGRKEIFHLEDSLGGLNVLARDGAADGRLMDPDHLGHLDHGQRLEEGHALLEEVALAVDDLLGDVRIVCWRWCRLLMRNCPARIFSRI